jgi:DNA repair ATPase RecN
MNEDELIAKLGQIEEQARLTLEEFPKRLTRERQRMIIALAKYIRSELNDRTLKRGEYYLRFKPGNADIPSEH